MRSTVELFLKSEVMHPTLINIDEYHLVAVNNNLHHFYSVTNLVALWKFLK